MYPEISTKLAHVSSFEELASIVEKAKEGVTFWGHRYIYVEGYVGTLSIHALAVSVMILRHNNYPSNQNYQTEKDYYYKTIPEIDRLYHNNNKRWIWWNPIAYLFDSISSLWEEISNPSNGPKLLWDGIYSANLVDFSEKPNKFFAIAVLPYATKEKIQSALANTPSLTELLSILKEVKEDVSLLGRRYIYIDRYDGTLPIDALVARIMELAKNTLVDPEMVSLIDEIYLKSDEKAKEKNLLTRVFCTIRDVWNQHFRKNSEGSRFQWEQYKKDLS